MRDPKQSPLLRHALRLLLQGTYQVLLCDRDDASGICKTMARSHVHGQAAPPKNGAVFDNYVWKSMKRDKKSGDPQSSDRPGIFLGEGHPIKGEPSNERDCR